VYILKLISFCSLQQLLFLHNCCDTAVWLSVSYRSALTTQILIIIIMWSLRSDGTPPNSPDYMGWALLIACAVITAAGYSTVHERRQGEEVNAWQVWYFGWLTAVSTGQSLLLLLLLLYSSSFCIPHPFAFLLLDALFSTMRGYTGVT
jgi:hypothetical protein